MSGRFQLRFLPAVAGALAVALLSPSTAAAQQPTKPARRVVVVPHVAAAEGRRLFDDRSGVLSTREGLHLRLVTNFGNVRVLTQSAAQVSYRVHIETAADEPDAAKFLKQFEISARSVPDGVHITGQVPWREFRGRLWVSFEVSIPRKYNVDVNTQAGSISVDDLDGRAVLVTSGGNIVTRRLGGDSRLETLGGHLTVQDVTGDLNATTAGGFITVGDVQGNANLRTGGGHIQVASVSGVAQLETAGGNISLQRSAGTKVTATSGGGRIDFGETSGAIQAQTSGGGIGILRVVGPTQLETGAGSIYLTKILGPVRASTASGAITAWFAPEGKLQGASQLQTAQGDIVVFVPRQVPLTIEATVEMGSEYRIDVDPAFAPKLAVKQPVIGGPLRAVYELNGGGEVIKLKTVAGDIKLRFSDAASDVSDRRLEMQMERARRQMEAQQAYLEAQIHRQWERMARDFESKAEEQAREIARQTYEQARVVERKVQEQQREVERSAERQAREAERLGKQHARETGRFEDLQRMWERWWGRVRIDPEEQKRKLVRVVDPVYTETAKNARIEGVVRLQVVIAKDGTVEEVRPISGHPLLAEAAIDAVKQWRYKPTEIDGKPVVVVTSVDVVFRLD